MSKVSECFLCGRLLADSEKRLVDVEPDARTSFRAEACKECWMKVGLAKRLSITRNDRYVTVMIARSQLDLFHSKFGRGRFRPIEDGYKR